MPIIATQLSYHISKMDCPSEEMMIRQAVAGVSEQFPSLFMSLHFNLFERMLLVVLLADVSDTEELCEYVSQKISALQLGDRLLQPCYLQKYHVGQMDCPSEKALIESKLAEFMASGLIQKLSFDLSSRTIHIHSTKLSKFPLFLEQIDSLKLGSKVIDCDKQSCALFSGLSQKSGVSGKCTGECQASKEQQNEEKQQRKLLWQVLSINAVFFVVEMTTGLVSDSMGLVADSLDMLADASVYGLSLLAVGTHISRQKQTAKWAGWLQIVLAMLGFLEVIRRFITFETMPNVITMITVSFLALLANSLCLHLLNKTQPQTAEQPHIRASQIFTSNDVIINIGMIFSAGLVLFFDSPIPDLVIGCVVFALVFGGARRILQLSR